MAQAKQKVKPANPCVMVIFGMAGDLTKRLLFPAVCNLGSNGLLDKNFTVVGVAADDYTTDSFRTYLKKSIKEFIPDVDAEKYGMGVAEKVEYIQGNFDDQKTYDQLRDTLKDLQKHKASKNAIFYFASPPQFMEPIASGLSKAGLLNEEGDSCFRRLVVEKPFGHDLNSAQELNAHLLTLVNEEQIFRIDHFLGKETVQNLLAFRFSNGLFEPIWNHLYIDHVQITVSETLGVELRGGYYEHAGALRDMVPNHLLQVLSLVAMEPPASFESTHIQDEKDKALQAIRIPAPEEVAEVAVRGQYGHGTIDNKKVPKYRDEANIDPHSSIETFVALKLSIDNWRWFNVPFYLRTGKRMKERTSEVTIQFKSGPSSLFTGCKDQIKPDILCIHIQPDEGISLRFNAKVPGTTMELEPVEMVFKYADYFGKKPSTGYETILYECMNGDHLLFKRAQTVELGWGIVQPLLNAWTAKKPSHFPNYDSGSWGPKAADMLIHKDGREWFP
jgi:glucose-6-phosphate 1-dehydrogenase